MAKSRTPKSELEQLRTRLATAEQTLTAIRHGDVDAITVDGPDGVQIFTLESVDKPYRIFAENMREGAASISAAGTILFCNPRLAEMLDVAQEKLLGSPLGDLVVPAEREAFRQLLACSLKGQAREEVHFQRSDGTILPVLASLKAIPLANGWGVCLVATDMSYRKQAEQAIRELNQELEHRVEARTTELIAANKELEAFTYSISHDLRAPLRHISAFCKILMEDFAPTLPSEAQEHLQRIEQGTVRMGQMVDDLLNLTRLGRREMNLQVSGLQSLVEETIATLEPDYRGREVEWRVGSLPFVECDSALMKQVFQNLLSNALKYTRPRARAVIEVGQQTGQGPPVIYVRDNGVGFSMKYADKLFGVFQRLHRQEDFEGTGVGLATVQRIIQKHGGRIWAEAELDKGATFYFTLEESEAEPRRDATPPQIETASPLLVSR